MDTVDRPEDINWLLLGSAVAFYREKGYRYVELPWFAPREIIAITCPSDERIITSPGFGDLVGSAEQSFLLLESKKNLGSGRFVACTPCFRNEPNLDVFHQKTFMKVEIYRNDIATEDSALELLDDALQFMSSIIPKRERFSIERTQDGFDILLNGIEVGSYGFRRHKDISWTYGTGLAEPRFSTACKFV